MSTNERDARLVSEGTPEQGRGAYRYALEAARLASEDARKASGGDPVEVHPSDSRAESQAGLNGPSGSPTSPPEPVPSAALPDPPGWAATITVPASYVHAIEAALAEAESALARAEEQVAAVRAALERIAAIKPDASQWHEANLIRLWKAVDVARAALGGAISGGSE